MQDLSIPSLLLDILVIAVTVGFVWYGIRRGFLVMLVGTCGRLISCFGAYVGSRALASTIYQVYVRDKLVSTVAATITDSFADYDISMQVSTVMQGIPGILRNMIYGVFGDTAQISEHIGEALSGSIQTVSSEVVDQIIYPVVYLLLQSILFLLLFFCLKIVIGALSETLRNIRRCFLVGVPDMLVGGLFGLIEALLCLFVVVVFIRLLIYASGAQIPMLTDENIQSTYLFKYFYNLSSFSGKW